MKTFATVWSLLTLLLFFSTTHWAKAQAPAWQMAITVGATVGSNTSTVAGTAIGPGGDVYIVGDFTGTVTFGAHTLTSAGSSDVFLAKWSPATARFVWVQQAGGTSGENGYALAVSGSNIYLTGVFTSTTATFGAISLTTASGGNVFVAKLTDAGLASSFTWASQSTNATGAFARAIAVSGTNVYIAGGFSGLVQFGTVSLTNPSQRISDIWVAKLTDTGSSATWGWAYQASGTDGDWVNGLAAVGNALYLTGYVTSPTATFGSLVLPNPGPSIGYVARLTDAGASGTFVWVQALGGTAGAVSNGLVAVGTQVYVAGSFLGTAAFGSTMLTSTGIPTNRAALFVTKLTDTGTASRFEWAVQNTGPASVTTFALALNGPNIFLAGGFFGGAATFGPTTLTTTTGITNIFLAKLTDAGATASFIWALQAGDTRYNYGNAVAVSSANVVYMGGSVTPPATFGAHSLRGTAMQETGFLASVNATPLATTPAAGFLTALYPNPAHGTVTIALPVATATTLTTLTLFDALGRAISTFPTTGPRTVLPLAGLPAGVYAVRLTTGGSSTVQRLVVE